MDLKCKVDSENKAISPLAWKLRLNNIIRLFLNLSLNNKSGRALEFHSEYFFLQMWVSIDFGKSWTKVQEHVKLLAWDESVTPANLYLQREEPSQSGENTRSVILKSDSLFLDPKSTEIIITGVEEFEIKDDFMFATRQKEKV